jgi:hypothetical protein
MYTIRRLGLAMAVAASLGLGVTSSSAAQRARPMADTVPLKGTVVMQLLAEPEPRLLGPGTDVAVHEGALSGLVQGGRYDVRISGGRAEGSGPRGAISVALDDQADGSLVVKGTWNGQPVDLAFEDGAVRGKLVHHVSGTAREVESCRVELDESRGARLTGLATCLGNQVPLQYTIEPGRGAALDRPEMALLMLAYLSAAPTPPDA